ncbi:MAG: GntR family transcriptional regulator [Rhodobacteraceae bacterium]|nr:GntR family transcriptional regulator [Paracoccaceae bacterium]
MGSKVALKFPEIPERANRTIQEYVYARLRNAIMVGAVPPGTPLTIRGIAEYMSLSPTPIREALRRLGSEHAIEFLGNRRMSIPEMSGGRFEELLHLRIAIEAHAGERSLPYISDNYIGEMRSLDDEMDRALRDGHYDELTILNHEFHRLLYAANPHQSAMPLIESVWLQLGPFQRLVQGDLKNTYLVDRHKEILQALKSRDALALRKAIEADIRDGIGRSGREMLTQ